MDIDKYKNKMEYPDVPHKPNPYNNHTTYDAIKCSELLKKYEEDMKAFKEKEKEYGQESCRLEQQFKKDLFSEYGVENNGKADLLYSKAYELGHHAGFSEVEIYFSDLVDLIR
jgi:hypothetical protein